MSFPGLEPFRCEVQPDREAVRVRPVGELDLASVPAVDAQLAELWSVGFANLVLDLRAVTFLDSSGLRMLLEWNAHNVECGLSFAVIPGPALVRRVLQTAGVADRLTYWSPNGSRSAAYG